MSDAPHDDALAAQAQAFVERFNSVLLATSDTQGVPEASYAPCLRMDDGAFHVYVSELSRHTANLLANPVASALFIEDESEARELFARTRLTFRCAAVEVARDSEPWRQVMTRFEETFGEVMQLLRPLTDFHLFTLQPRSGVYVTGFARAYRFEGPIPQDFRHSRP